MSHGIFSPSYDVKDEKVVSILNANLLMDFWSDESKARNAHEEYEKESKSKVRFWNIQNIFDISNLDIVAVRFLPIRADYNIAWISDKKSSSVISI